MDSAEENMRRMQELDDARNAQYIPTMWRTIKSGGMKQTRSATMSMHREAAAASPSAQQSSSVVAAGTSRSAWRPDRSAAMLCDARTDMGVA